MKKIILFILLLLNGALAFSESLQVPYEIKDPATTENFRNIYYDVDTIRSNTSTATLSGQFIQNQSDPQSSAVFNVSSGTVSTEFNVGSGGSIFDANSSGQILQRLQPCFLTTTVSPSPNVTGDGTTANAEFNTERYDVGSNFNTATYTFTAPVSGKYLFTAHIRVTGLSGGFTDGNIELLTSNRSYYDQEISAVIGTKNLGLSVIADMGANDTAKVTFTMSGGAKTAELSGTALNDFSGSLIN